MILGVSTVQIIVDDHHPLSSKTSNQSSKHHPAVLLEGLAQCHGQSTPKENWYLQLSVAWLFNQRNWWNRDTNWRRLHWRPKITSCCVFADWMLWDAMGVVQCGNRLILFEKSHGRAISSSTWIAEKIHGKRWSDSVVSLYSPWVVLGSRV